ncbi:MAG: S9 family peptidase [Endozoicomonas sp.]
MMKALKIPALLLPIFLSGCVINTPSDDYVALEEPQKLIPITDLFNESKISHLKLSSDGQWLAWLQDNKGVNNLYLKSVNSQNSHAYPLTDFTETIKAFQWAKNSNDIFYLQDFGGDENHQIYHLELSGEQELKVAESRRLTTRDKTNYRLLGQVKNDHGQLIYMANHDDPARIDLYSFDLKSGEQKRILQNDHHFLSIEVDENGQPAAGVKMNPDSSYELFSFSKGTWTTRLKTQPGESIDLLQYNQKKNRAYISTSLGELDKLGLMSINLSNSNLTSIHEDPNNLSDLFKASFSEDGAPLMVSYYYGHKEDYVLETDFAEHWQNIQNHFKEKKEITLLERNENTGKSLLLTASGRDAGSYYFYDEKKKKLEWLLNKDSQLNPDLLSPRTSITYKTRDGETIQAYLTLPLGKTSDLPAIVLPHGGPWARDYWTLDAGYFNRVAQLLANRGYAVLQPNFRASTGFGERFYNLGNQNWGTGYMQHDLSDGAQYLIDKDIADPERIGILGASYGGYAALAGITFTPDLYQAAISYVGPSSLVTLMNSFPEYYRPYLGNWFTAVGDPLIPADVENMQSRSPINFVDNIETPLLLIQGANDPRVTQQESDNIARQMFNKGLPVEYILAEDEGHGFYKRENNLAALLQMERFFAEHLGGKLQPLQTAEVEQHLESLKVDISKL